MSNQFSFAIHKVRLITAVLLIALFFFSGFLAGKRVEAHGGKTHQDSFTALQALQKATQLYDQLIIKGKLDESWEVALEKVDVIARRHPDDLEYRVGFHRSAGDPQAVYIFLSSEGKYSGSNFDGKW